ncbi:hypothetical protein [Miniphocaeibacter massiliensis]|uniref:hypothetical protein n=1 Tax=Miniphocaeibacter massiliensis TaxID=2041841 RepID=UPI000C08919D|nr:hypothetical protein [Miniphocaeibacter massiliensis]
MIKFFEKLKEENPQLLLKIYNDLEDIENSFKTVQTYDIDFKGYKELKTFYEEILKIKEIIPIEGIQLSLNILNNEKIFSNAVNLTYDFTFAKPKSYSIYRGKNIEVSSFKELYEQILLYLFKIDKTKMYSLINKTKFNGTKKPYFSKNKDNMINSFKISDNLYAETHFSSKKFSKMLIRLFNLYNIDINNLKIYIKYDKKEKYRYYE